MPNILRKTIPGPFTGIHFEIRRVRVREFMQALGELPFPIDAKTLMDMKALQESVAQLDEVKKAQVDRKSTDFFLQHGIVKLKYPEGEWQAPNIWYGPDEACPDNMVTIADLGSDGDYISGEIMSYSFVLGGMQAFANFFRGNSAGDAGHGGTEIQPETLPLTPNGNGS